MGLICGLMALLLIEGMGLAHRSLRRIRHGGLRASVGGWLVVGLGLLLPSAIGLGVSELYRLLQGQESNGLFPLFKIAATSITLEAGGSGGIVTPIFLIGAGTGNFIAGLLGVDRGAFAAMGMLALLSAAANTPIAASVMALEMFGGHLGPHAAMACVVSFLMVGHRSVYPSQIVSLAKSPSLRVEMGQEIREMEVEIAIREDSMMGVARRGAQRLPQTVQQWRAFLRNVLTRLHIMRPTSADREVNCLKHSRERKDHGNQGQFPEDD